MIWLGILIGVLGSWLVSAVILTVVIRANNERKPSRMLTVRNFSILVAILLILAGIYAWVREVVNP